MCSPGSSEVSVVGLWTWMRYGMASPSMPSIISRPNFRLYSSATVSPVCDFFGASFAFTALKATKSSAASPLAARSDRAAVFFEDSFTLNCALCLSDETKPAMAPTARKADATRTAVARQAAGLLSSSPGPRGRRLDDPLRPLAPYGFRLRTLSLYYDDLLKFVDTLLGCSSNQSYGKMKDFFKQKQTEKY